MSDESPGLAAWLATADNRETWTRLRDGLALADGFELLFGVVVDPQAGAWLSELLEARARELGRRFVQLDARDDDVLSKLTSLAEAGEVLVVLDTVAASRRAVANLERSLLELNPRRDLLATAIPGPILIVARPDGLRRVADLAPDLFSVHTARFVFSGGADLGLDDQPDWLLSDHEFVGLLGIDPSFGFADWSLVPRIVREPPRPPERLFGRDAVLAELEGKLVPGGERRIDVVGQPGVGRTALVARAVELARERWDRVIWLDCRHVATWPEYDEVIAAVIEELAPGEVVPFAIEDARERFVELTTLHAVLIVADDLLFHPRAMPGSRSCLLAIRDGEADATESGDLVLAPLDMTALQALADSEGLPATADLQSLSRGLPACVRLLGRWLRGQDEPGTEALARLVRHEGATAGLSELCRLLAKDRGQASVRAFEALLGMSRWVLEFPRDWMVSDATLTELERLGILIAARDGYRFAENGVGRWQYFSQNVLFEDWRTNLPSGPTADHLYATLSHALRDRLAWLSAAGLTRHDIERCAASVAPPLRAATLREATVLPMQEQDDVMLFDAALRAALRCGQAEYGRQIHEQLTTYRRTNTLFGMLVSLRPTEWDPHLVMSSVVSGLYAMNEAESPIAAALRRGLNLQPQYSDDPLPDAPAARAALALRTQPCTPATIHEFLEALDDTVELDQIAAHFLYARLAWLQIAANDWPNFERSLAELERSARAWGYPYALVRSRLLELTALEARGELDRAAAKLPTTLAAVERCYGSRSRTAIALLRRAARIYVELDRSEDAKQALAQISARRRET